MYTKEKRIHTWVTLAAFCIICGGAVEVLAELYLPNGSFQKGAAFMFFSSTFLGVVGISLAFWSLAVNDWHESKNTKSFVNLGHHNDRIISVYNLQDAILHLPVAGTVHQTIVAPSKADIPYIAGETLEHIHFGNQIPKVEVMDDELYQRLFGPLNNKEK
jgi:hypothetical protein